MIWQVEIPRYLPNELVFRYDQECKENELTLQTVRPCAKDKPDSFIIEDVEYCKFVGNGLDVSCHRAFLLPLAVDFVSDLHFDNKISYLRGNVGVRKFRKLQHMRFSADNRYVAVAHMDASVYITFFDPSSS